MLQTRSFRNAQPTIRDGDLIFVRNKNAWFSKIIRFATRSQYSHVGIAFWITVAGKEHLMVIEAQGGTERRIITMDYYSDTGIDVIRAPRVWSEYCDVAFEQVGKLKYGWREAIYVGLRELLFKYAKIRLPPRDFDGEICSEFAARMMQLDNFHVSPQGLIDALAEKGHLITLHIR